VSVSIARACIHQHTPGTVLNTASVLGVIAHLMLRLCRLEDTARVGSGGGRPLHSRGLLTLVLLLLCYMGKDAPDYAKGSQRGSGGASVFSSARRAAWLHSLHVCMYVNACTCMACQAQCAQLILHGNYCRGLHGLATPPGGLGRACLGPVNIGSRFSGSLIGVCACWRDQPCVDA
jgi:hypothetical protein